MMAWRLCFKDIKPETEDDDDKHIVSPLTDLSLLSAYSLVDWLHWTCPLTKNFVIPYSLNWCSGRATQWKTCTWVRLTFFIFYFLIHLTEHALFSISALFSSFVQCCIARQSISVNVSFHDSFWTRFFYSLTFTQIFITGLDRSCLCIYFFLYCVLFQSWPYPSSITSFMRWKGPKPIWTALAENKYPFTLDSFLFDKSGVGESWKLLNVCMGLNWIRD